MADNNLPSLPEVLPVVATTNLVVFPLMLSPLLVQRAESLAALDAALAGDRLIALTLQRDESIEATTPENLHETGCACAIVRMTRQPDGSAQVIVQGVSRVHLSEYSQDGGVLHARLEALPEDTEKPLAVQALMNNLLGVFRRIVELHPALPDEAFAAAQAQEQPGRLADFVASTLNIEVGVRQELLAETSVQKRLERVTELAGAEVNVLELSSQIQDATRQELDKGQRDFILRQQLREIQKQLGDDDSQEAELEELRRQIDEAQMTPEARRAADREMERLARMPQAAAEYSVVRNYLDYLIAMPWTKTTEDNLDIAHAERILDEEHYGLEDVKERVLDYLAVRKLNPDGKGPILCFVGPPGVGKTSLAHSIAHALGREFVRMALGGVRDEAEIRGHRRTYIGAMPGRIAQGLRDAGTSNPVMILDEIDKLGADYRGDPTSALLEVLDPQQNSTFKDHYLEVPIDLSQVMFITTANVLDTIPAPLRDRMEVLRIAGYAEEEKVFIAERYLLPRQMTENGLTPSDLSISRDALRGIVRGYTREAGVRNLERELATVCRKIARRVATEGAGREAPGAGETAEQTASTRATENGAAQSSDATASTREPQNGTAKNAVAQNRDAKNGAALGAETQTANAQNETPKTENAAAQNAAPRALKSAAELAQQRFAAEAPSRDDSNSHNATASTREENDGAVSHRPESSAPRPTFSVAASDLEEYLGPVRFQAEMGNRAAQVGVSTGMAWTPVGGEVLFIESVALPGKGHLHLTGQLGEVMKESASIALDFLRAHAAELGLDPKFSETHDIHVHVPAGAIPKDGPSAGVAMTTALASLMSGRPARHDISMTGEVTLTGRVLPIGGVKEKVLAARQAGIKTILLPERNRADVQDVPEEARAELEFRFLDDVRDALEIVLLPRGAANDESVPDVATPLEQDADVALS